MTALPKLRNLNLSACNRITDEGLSTLAKMTSLEQLRLQTNSQLTETAIRKLQAALPDCRIESDFSNITAMATPAVSPIDFNAERRAAEQLLKLHKGYIALMDNNGNLVELKESFAAREFLRAYGSIPQCGSHR